MEILHWLETAYFHAGRLVRRRCVVQFYTMFSPGEIFALFEERRKELGLSQAEVSIRAFGRADNTAIQSLKKGSSPAIDRVAAMAKALGLDLYLGPFRDPAPAECMVLESGEYAHIPLHDALLAAGGGACNVSEEVVDSLAFKQDWLKRLGIPASAARVARVHGDSMQPSLWHGDVILIDTNSSDPAIRAKDRKDQRRSPIYAIIDSGEARVKRVQRIATDAMLLLSDNPDYPPEVRQGKDLLDLTIIGRVAWWGHTNRD